MALTSKVSNPETSSNPATGKVTGDSNPSVTQDGILTKWRDADDEIAADLAALKIIWDSHDHDPSNPTGAGGPPIGSNGERSIGPAAVQNALIDTNAITGGKTASGAIQTSHIQDETVESAQLGDPETHSKTIAPGASYTWTHGKVRYLLFHVESDNSEFEHCLIGDDLVSITVTNPPTNSLAVDITIRSYG